MLAANETVAERFYWLEVPFMYRVHDLPDTEKLDRFSSFIYGLYYIKQEEDRSKKRKSRNIKDFMFFS
jgi:exoribonuclease R